MKFHNKVVWITGASSGIGEALAYAFAAEGAQLVLSARREEELQRVAKACGNAYVLPFDILSLVEHTDRVQDVMNTYGRVPIALQRGQGCRVWDVNGKEYLDALGGIAVNTLGHAHPKLTPALQDQVGKMIHSCNYYHIPLQEALAAKLVELSGMTNVFFCCTGLEANEAALKLARKYGSDHGDGRFEVLTALGSFHGRTIATIAASAATTVLPAPVGAHTSTPWPRSRASQASRWKGSRANGSSAANCSSSVIATAFPASVRVGTQRRGVSCTDTAARGKQRVSCP